MTGSSDDMLEEAAKIYGIILNNASIECHLLIYAVVFANIKTLLIDPDAFPLEQTQRIKKALNTISLCFETLHECTLQGKPIELETSKHILLVKPKLKTALANVSVAITLYLTGKKELKVYSEEFAMMLNSYTRNLLTCRECITEINDLVKSWRKQEEVEDCQNQRRAG